MAPKEHEISQTDILLQIAQTLAQVQDRATQGVDVAQALEGMTKTLSELATRTRPENPEHSGISAYSNPLGDYKDPKKPLKCEVFWVGYPLTLETIKPSEVAALNSLEPGTYQVTKGNGDVIPFQVDGKRKQNGELESLWIQFPCKGDQMHDHRSMIDYCREAMGEKVPTLDSLVAELERVKRDLSTAQAVIAAA